jgi:hypothetical protein
MTSSGKSRLSVDLSQGGPARADWVFRKLRTAALGALLCGGLFGCDEDESVRDLVAAFRNAEDDACAKAGALLRQRQGDPLLGFYFGGYCWPEDTPWSQCIGFKKGFSWGPPAETCWEGVKPHLECLTHLKSEAECSKSFPLSPECNPLVPELPKRAPQDCYCKAPSFFADYKGTAMVQEFREGQAQCGPENLSFELHCSILDEACGTTCGCYESKKLVGEVYVSDVRDMSFRGRAWVDCGFPAVDCQ